MEIGMNENFSKASDLINDFFDQNSQAQKVIPMLSTWSKVVSTIKNNGLQLADHSRVVDFKNGTILVEADHSAWIQILQINKKYILVGLNRNLPQLKINNIVFKLSGQKFSEPKKREPTRAELLEELNKKYEPLQKDIEEKYESKNNSNQMNKKLEELFDRLKNKINQIN